MDLGRYTEAIAVVEQLSYIGDKALCTIAKKQAETGRFSESKATAGRLLGTPADEAYAEIAKAQIERGLIDEAKTTLNAIWQSGSARSCSMRDCYC